MADSCITLPDGTQCPEPSNWTDCSPWDLTEQGQIECYVDSLQQQALGVAGAKINVYKLLGVHEQTSLVDLAKNGTAISGGDWTGFPAGNAFTTYNTEWRSKQSGASAITASAYIGYDFGFIKIPTGRRQYGIDTSIRHQITTIKIKQSSNPEYRVTKVRVERSTDKIGWFGVAVIDLPNNDTLNTISFKNSVPNRYWRLRPLAFAGESCDSWGVQALELIDYDATALNNIQDKIWLENRNRDYASPIQLRGYYDLITGELDVTKFMAEMGESGTYRIKINFTSAVGILGRPIVIGDYLELPSEAQYTPSLALRKRYLEVTDVTWDPETYTPGWMPTMLLITAKPGIASEETQDIFGDLSKQIDQSGLFNNDDGNNQNYQDYSTVEQTIEQKAKNKVPERGSTGSSVFREFSEENQTFDVTIISSVGPIVTLASATNLTTGMSLTQDGNTALIIQILNATQVRVNSDIFWGAGAAIAVGPLSELAEAALAGFPSLRRLNFNRTGLYVEDAMPQNDAPFTEGTTFPTNPNNGDYHRLIYVGLSKDVPARLYRWSTTKGRWVYLETDRRAQYNDQKAVLDEYLSSPLGVPPEDVAKVGD
ncbi:MAG: hypothetical protein E4H14_09580 [Candidatus Thorarchaeota archaeon]|nr:MAG: hypothetical protein E4H14_09580 [Candidatus Thorarchaeota archaeon]